MRPGDTPSQDTGRLEMHQMQGDRPMTANQPTNQPDRVLTTNKQTNKQTGRLYQGFFWNLGDEGDLSDRARLDKLRRQDGWTSTRILKTAIHEYVERHDPGNPALPLTHWTTGEPFSIAAQEKFSKLKASAGPPLYNLRCRFCGQWFETDIDMAHPSCPKCTKPEAPA